MDIPLIFKEMAVVIAVDKQDSKVLTPEFLAQCGIVPRDWVLASPPVQHEGGSLIRYTNHYAIASNPKQVQLVQPFAGEPREVMVTKMAQRYCDILSNLIYRAIGINFKAFADLQDYLETPNDFILEFLHPDKINTKPSKVSLNLSYFFERNTLNLSVVDAALNNPDGTTQPGIVFTGNCETRFEAQDSEYVQNKINTALNVWEIDFARYTTIVTDFLK